MPLTDAQIKQIKPPKDTGKHFDGGGLYLELTTTGAKYWRLKYRFGGERKPHQLRCLSRSRTKGCA